MYKRPCYFLFKFSYNLLYITAFLVIFLRFPTTFRKFPKILQTLSSGQIKVKNMHFPVIYEDIRDLPKTKEDALMSRSYINNFKRT